jgi:CubicO group peptidase (beta-lactamase class C family)
MKSNITAVVFCLIMFNVSFAQDLSGKWKGKLKQGATLFNFELDLQKLDSINYTCITTIQVGGEYGVMRAKCSFKNNNLYFKENEIVSDKSTKNHWCLKTANLSYFKTSSIPRLQGKWTGGCAPGRIEVAKVKPATKFAEQPSTKKERKAEINSRIDNIFSEWDNIYSPGCALGVIKNGELIYTKGYGMGNLDYKIPLTVDSKFYIASTTKQFTAACIALLSIEGKLSLDDEVQKHIPELPKYQDKITVRNLIHHTSGLRDYLLLMRLSGKSFEDYFSIDDGIRLLSRQNGTNFSSGDEYLYSNSGYMLLAEIVNRVSGMTIRKYANQNIFQPLGMTNTFFNDDHSQVIENRVVSYHYQSNTLKRFVQNFDALGDGNLITTINDMYLWDQNFYHHKVGGKEFTDLILTQGKLNNGDTTNYAFGLIHGKYKGLKTVSHGGAFLGFRTEFIRFPKQNFSVIIFSNVSNFTPTSKTYQIADLLLNDQLTEIPKETKKVSNSDTLKKLDLNQLIGNYEMQAGVFLEITLKNSSLHVLQSWNKSSYKIINTKENSYGTPNNPSIQFSFSELKDGFSQILILREGRGESVWKRREKIHFPNENLEIYTGDYYCKELAVSYFIFLEDGKLKLKVANHNPQKLELTDLDTFIADLGILRFNKLNGEIQSFELDAGRVTNLKFEKKQL